MAKQKNSVNKSEEIRQVLKANPKIGVKEVVSALAEKGIKVSENLVYLVKGEIQGRKGKKKKASKKEATVAEANGTVNMSEAIRQVFKASPELKAKEVVATLAAKGIEVKEGLVYLVKGQMKGRKKRKEKVRKMVEKVVAATGTTATAATGDAVSLILKVKTLASEVGGMDKLKALVEVLG